MGNGEDQKFYVGSMIVGREFTAAAEARTKSITAGTLGAIRRTEYMKSRGMVTRSPRNRLVVDEEQQGSNVCPFREKAHGRSLARSPRDAYSTGGEGISRVE